MAYTPGPGPWNPEKPQGGLQKPPAFNAVKGVAGPRPSMMGAYAKPSSSFAQPFPLSEKSPLSGSMPGPPMPGPPPFEKPGAGQSSTPWVPTPYPQPQGPGAVKPPWGPPDTDPYTPGGYDGSPKPWRPQFDEFGRPIGGLQGQGNFMRPYMNPQQILQILMGMNMRPDAMRPPPPPMTTRPYQY